LAATFGVERATRTKFSFPFYNPKPPQFNIQKFPLLPQGRISFWAWQATRVLSWYAVNKLCFTVVLTSYALSVYAVNVSADGRLQGFHREHARREGTARTTGQPRPIPHESSGQSYQQFPQQKWDESASATEPVGWTSSEQTEKATSAPPPSSWAATQNPQNGRQDPYSQESYVFDDASPVAPSEQTNYSSQNQGQQGGSAWDRIRVQAQAARNQPGSRAKKSQDEMTSRGAQDGSSYNYSALDEEKAYAKDQAQKEFDEMLERERRGQGR
jgi:hypothetical protein